MIKKEVKYYFIKLLLSILLIIIGYINNSLQCFGAGLFFFTIFHISFILSVVKIKFKIKKEDRKKIEKDIEKSIYKYDSVCFTNDYIYLYDEIAKIYYKDIIVIDIIPSKIFGRMSSIAYKYLIYLKNGKKYSFKRHWQDQVDNDIEKIIKMKNSKVYFGKYKDYKKFNKELDRKIAQELLMSRKGLNKLKK